MLDTADSTLSSAPEEPGSPLLAGFQSADEAEDERFRYEVEDMAMAVAYTWLTRDRGAQDEFLDRILGQNPNDLAIMIAVDTYTRVRLYGIKPGTLRPDVEVTTEWTPGTTLDNVPQPGDSPGVASPAEQDTSGDEGVADQRDWSDENVAIITDLWTGYATGEHGRMTRAKVEVFEIPVVQVRELLRVMAYDASIAIEQFTVWREGGADVVENYRREVPPDNAVTPPSVALASVTPLRGAEQDGSPGQADDSSPDEASAELADEPLPPDWR